MEEVCVQEEDISELVLQFQLKAAKDEKVKQTQTLQTGPWSPL